MRFILAPLLSLTLVLSTLSFFVAAAPSPSTELASVKRADSFSIANTLLERSHDHESGSGHEKASEIEHDMSTLFKLLEHAVTVEHHSKYWFLVALIRVGEHAFPHFNWMAYRGSPFSSMSNMGEPGVDYGSVSKHVHGETLNLYWFGNAELEIGDNEESLDDMWVHSGKLVDHKTNQYYRFEKKD